MAPNPQSGVLILLCNSPHPSAVFTRVAPGSIAELVQQFLQKIAPPLNDAENQIIPVGVSRRQMPSVHKAVNVALSFAPGFEQCLDGGAFVYVASDQLPPLLLKVPDRVVRKLWCADQYVEIVRYAGCAQDGFS
jgi:hypothetical protein